VIAKQHGAPNDITNARVTLKALASLKPVALNNVFTKKKVTTEVKKEEKAVAKKTPVKKAPAKKVPAKKKAE
jgi:hypothetical protein